MAVVVEIAPGGPAVKVWQDHSAIVEPGRAVIADQLGDRNADEVCTYAGDHKVEVTVVVKIAPGGESAHTYSAGGQAELVVAVVVPDLPKTSARQQDVRSPVVVVITPADGAGDV